MCLETIAERNWLTDLICLVFILNYSSWEHISKSMFSRPQMCLETVAEKLTHLFNLLSFQIIDYSSEEHIKKQWFSDPKCVWKQ